MSELENLQPFECYVCHSRFTRRENLKRHAALHLQSAETLPCSMCSATFSRKDLRRRHIRRKHGDAFRVQNASTRPHSLTGSEMSDIDDRVSDAELEAMSMTNGYRDHHAVMADTRSLEETEQSDNSFNPCLQLPTNSLAKTHIDLPTYSMTASPTTASDISQVMTFDMSPVETAASSYRLSGFSPDVLRHQNHWFPSSQQITLGLDLFFRHVSHFVPFLHQATFNERDAPVYLTLSILSLGFHYQDNQSLSKEEENSGAMLAIQCFHRARTMMSSIEVTAVEETESVAMIQAYILLQICAMLYLCGADSAHALRMHPKMIALVRSSGLMQWTTDHRTETRCLTSLWHDFISKESRKRTVYAVHQLDSLYYQLLSMPRMLSNLEIKHDLPCPTELWNAPTAADWAHKRLTNDTGNALPSYIETVRDVLSPSPSISDLSRFDSYGAINIAQFLISSAREISGWSAMTGRVSMDRFEPLRSALEALLQSLYARTEISASTSSTSQATWEIAMIELQLWSPSHTSGSVADSIDSVLLQWTSACQGPWSETLFSASKKIQPHLNWYLQYLDQTFYVELEAPWIVLYAYRAFLAALELLRGGASEAMSIIGISVGERERALEWAKNVFERRRRWTLGRLILEELDGL